MKTITSDHLTCSSCAIPQPVSEFRRRSRSSSARLSQCRTCHNSAERERRRQRQAEQHQQEVGRRITQVKNASSEEELRRLCTAMLAQFGDLKGVVNAWMDYYQEARRTGSPRALKCLQAIARLVQSENGARTQSSQPTTEEINHKYAQLIKCLLRENPRLVSTAASEVGWRLDRQGGESLE